MAVRAFSAVIETSEEDAVIEVSKFIGQLLGQVRRAVGAAPWRALPACWPCSLTWGADAGSVQSPTPPMARPARRSPPSPRNARPCTRLSSTRSCWTSSSAPWTPCWPPAPATPVSGGARRRRLAAGGGRARLAARLLALLLHAPACCCHRACNAAGLHRGQLLWCHSSRHPCLPAGGGPPTRLPTRCRASPLFLRSNAQTWSAA